MSEGRTSGMLLVHAQLFFGMVFFGTGTPSAKVVGDSLPLFLRLLLAALVLTPLLVIHRKRLPRVQGRDWLEIAVIGGVAFTLFLTTGMQRVNGVIGAVVMSLSPAATAVGVCSSLTSRGNRSTRADGTSRSEVSSCSRRFAVRPHTRLSANA